MEFYIEDVRVFFPYAYVYPEQHAYMTHLKHLLDAALGGPGGAAGLLEMPCGTGKTVCCLALVCSYQLARPAAGTLFFCSRTVPECEAALRELRRVHAHLAARTRGTTWEGVLRDEWLGVGLASRATLCANPAVLGRAARADLDGACRALAPELGGPGCAWRAAGAAPETGVRTLEELRGGAGGAEQPHYCPYYEARRLMRRARVVVLSYQYLLSPAILESVVRPALAPGERAILVLDEAHNTDNVCLESLSVKLGRPLLEDARELCGQLETRVQQASEATAERLQDEYSRLVAGLRAARAEVTDANGGGNNNDNDNNNGDELEEPLPPGPTPGALRKAAPFLRLLGRTCSWLELQLATGDVTRVERPASFMWRLREDLALPEARALVHCGARLASLLRALQVGGGRETQALREVARLLSTLGKYGEGDGFCVLRYAASQVPRPEQRLGWDDGMVALTCVDASLAFRGPQALFTGGVLLTSATLSPMNMFPKLLGLRPALLESVAPAGGRRCLLPLVVAKGADQALLSSKFSLREDAGTHRAYATLIEGLAATVPDGMICFFPSYQFLETCVASWHGSGALQRMLKHKLLFLETRNARETGIALTSYQAACDAGRGAILFCVARGKVSEGVDFSHHTGRCAVVLGMPYQYTKAPALLQRLLFFRTEHNISASDYLTFDALRHAAQCTGRVIRSKSDYAVMVLADARYAFKAKQDKLPAWIRKDLSREYSGLDSDVALALIRRFIREMAQPYDLGAKIGTELWALEHIPGQPEHLAGRPEPMDTGE